VLEASGSYGSETGLLLSRTIGIEAGDVYQKMKPKIDSIRGRLIYNRRLGTAEPPFAHICSILGLDRFTLRKKPKVNTQWLFYCIVHNLTKVHRYGEGLAVREGIDGWVSGCELYHGNKDIASRNTKVSASDDDNLLFSIQVKEHFFKN